MNAPLRSPGMARRYPRFKRRVTPFPAPRPSFQVAPGHARRMRSHENKKAGVSPGLFVSCHYGNQAIASW